jgi:ABC-type Na+ efflux pump permease subunit
MTPFPGGTKLPCEGGRIYHFLPNEHNHYVAEVLNDKDYDAILSISQGYQPYGKKDLERAEAEAAANAKADAEDARITQQQINDDTEAARRSMAAEVEQRQEMNAANRTKLAKARAKFKSEAETEA